MMFDYFITEIITNSSLNEKDGDKADIFLDDMILSLYYNHGPSYTKYAIDPIKDKYPYFNRSQGIDHILLQNTFACHLTPFRPKDEKEFPGMTSMGDLNWPYTIEHPRAALRNTVIPYAARTEYGSMDDYESKNKTFYFLGTVELEAPVGGPVRRKLKQAIENKTGVTFIKTVRLNAKLQAESYGRNIQQWMRQSKFCIVPHGDSPSSKRLIDTIQSLCVPVILSDPIRFPFEEVFIDYQKIVIQIPMWSPETLIPVVEKFNTKEEILSRMKAMKNVRRNFDVNIFHQLEKRDQAWMWIWLHYIKICTVKSMMRRELLPSAYDI